ncbi:hypothetical protein [Azospirillum rugosum]|uniref:Uncharacterized protein n=1 Tax=Azospirillum rugosum TaxID=416170 RepID=A0ABS4SX21_9PROT|nr:hypothetical protein [Azospirillum rugosum]MBP2297096.1 hypothetical protein [Azospirillum rugosum]MDQ0530938.1 hypothetical protein [Azospirillum rugosum]
MISPLSIPLDLADPRLPEALRAKTAAGRVEVLDALRSTPEFAGLMKTWLEGDAYRAVGARTVLMNLYRNPDGSVLGVAQGADGRFIGQARWVKVSGVGAKLLSSATMLAGHAMLLELSRKLDRVEHKVDRIAQALRDDRREGLRGAIDAVHNALSCRTETAAALLAGAATPLITHVRQEIRALQRDIDALRPMPEWHITKTFNDPSDDIRRALRVCEQSFLAIGEGIRTVGQLYVGLDEPKTAWTAMGALFEELSGVGLDKAERRARQLQPTRPHPWPDRFWMEARRALDEVRLLAEENASEQPAVAFRPLALEFGDGELERVPWGVSEAAPDLVASAGERQPSRESR